MHFIRTFNFSLELLEYNKTSLEKIIFKKIDKIRQYCSIINKIFFYYYKMAKDFNLISYIINYSLIVFNEKNYILFLVYSRIGMTVIK